MTELTQKKTKSKTVNHTTEWSGYIRKQSSSLLVTVSQNENTTKTLAFKMMYAYQKTRQYIIKFILSVASSPSCYKLTVNQLTL